MAIDCESKKKSTSLTGIKDKGIPTFDQMKETLEPLAKKAKKTEDDAASKTGVIDASEE